MYLTSCLHLVDRTARGQFWSQSWSSHRANETWTKVFHLTYCEPFDPLLSLTNLVVNLMLNLHGIRERDGGEGKPCMYVQSLSLGLCRASSNRDMSYIEPVPALCVRKVPSKFLLIARLWSNDQWITYMSLKNITTAAHNILLPGNRTTQCAGYTSTFVWQKVVKVCNLPNFVNYCTSQTL